MRVTRPEFNRRKREVAVGVIMAATVLPTAAQQNKATPRKLDGINLLRACEAPEAAKWGESENALDYGYCMGVIRGVDFWLLPKGCADDVSTDQRVMVVTKYLKDHPEELNLPDALLVSTALSKAFPYPTSHIK
jgi:Ssp1 endopeptidase immunity protein Rap1a